MNFSVNESWHGKTVVALDVATQSTGWAAWHKEALFVGAIQTPSPYVYERIQKLAAEMYCQVAMPFTPDIVVIEAGFAETGGESVYCPKCNTCIHGTTNFYDRSAEVTMMLAEARGAAESVFRCPIMKISNTAWKKALGIESRDRLKRDRIKYEVYLEACALWDCSLPITMLKKKATYDASDAAAMLAVVLRDMRYDG